MPFAINDSKIADSDYSEFIISCIKKTVKQEDSLVRQIVYTMLSAYSNNPINLGIIAPTSEGKSYPVIQAAEFVPKEDIWKIGAMSTKVLVRQKGILVDRNNEPISHKVREVKASLKAAGNKQEDRRQLEEELEQLLDGEGTLIDLSNKILLFLEPPQHELWNLIKPILSHDDKEIEFPFVDRTEGVGLIVKRIVVRGWPACIFCSARDDSSWQVWPEIESRFLIVSPNMNKQKYFESNLLIAQRKGLPNVVQQKLIISDEEKELAKECFLYLKDQIQQRSAGGITGKGSAVWIPYGQLLAEVLPSNKGSDSRNTNRIFALLNIIPLTKAHLKPRLVYGSELLVVATLEDLREVLHITQDVTGMPVYKLKFYKEIFLPLFRSKRAPDRGDNSKAEKIICLTSREICDYYNSTKDIKPITVDNLKKTFLDELLNHGYIEQETSAINAKQNIYYPLIDIEDEQSSWSSYPQKTDSQEQQLKVNAENGISNLSNEGAFDKDLQFSRLILPANCKSIPDNWLNLEILELMAYRLDPKFRLLDDNGNQVCICSFVNQYENPLTLSRFVKIPQNAISNKIFGEGIRKIATKTQDPANTKSNQVEFDKKVNDTTAIICSALDNSSHHLSHTTEMVPEHHDNYSIQLTHLQQSSPTYEPQQHVTEASRDNSNSSALQNYVAFDLEWRDNHDDNGSGNNRTIYAAAFIDNHGNSRVLHLSDFVKSSDKPERQLLLNINQELLRYDMSIGWYSTGIAKYHEDTQEYLDGVDSDLATLHGRCLANGIDSIVDFNSAGMPYVRDRNHIDLHSVFGKPMVQTTIFKNAYRTLKLDEVSRAVLSGEQQTVEAVAGKYKGLTGKDVQSVPIEEQKKYVLRDAELVMRLSKHNNSEVLDALEAISELTGLDFERVCRTGISTWWATIFDTMVRNGECKIPSLGSIDRSREKSSSELRYVGGSVLQPKKGLYHDLIVVDVTSLYPTMAILRNLSFDTINCGCCEDILQYRIDKDITKDCKIEEEYWVCRQKEGAFPKKLEIFKEERLKQKKLGNRVKQLALKVLINGGYGVFGSQYFKYYDPRVAELITAYGRYTISKMKDIAQNMGFEIVYGDTDSLFLHLENNIDANKTGLSLNTEESVSKFKEECSKRLGIEVEHTKTYRTAIISDKKKHYVGWTGIQGKESDIVGMEGDKNDRPKWINSIFRETVNDILTNSNDPILNLKKAISNLETGNVDSELLKRSNRLSKNPDEYENENDRKRKIGLAIHARKGDIIEYFESDGKEGYSLNSQDISFKKYKIMLWKAVKDILEIAGYDIAALEQEEGDHMAKPPRGVVGYAS